MGADGIDGRPSRARPLRARGPAGIRAGEPRRVALVCPYSWSWPGGVQSHFAGLATALRALGVEVDVLAPADSEDARQEVIPLGRSVPIRTNGSVQRVALAPSAVARTTRLVRSGRYDLVHLHEPMIPSVCLTSLLAALARALDELLRSTELRRRVAAAGRARARELEWSRIAARVLELYRRALSTS